MGAVSNLRAQVGQLARDLARLAESAPPAPPPEDTPAAFAERWTKAANAILASMPAEYARSVVQELERPELTWGDLLAGHGRSPLSPLAYHVADMAKRAAYQAVTVCARPYTGPLCVPAAVCALLVDLPPDEVLFSAYECAACGLEIPYPSLAAVQRPGSLAHDRRPGQVGYFRACPHCGGTALRWAAMPATPMAAPEGRCA
jgi:hypothetical protein